MGISIFPLVQAPNGPEKALQTLPLTPCRSRESFHIVCNVDREVPVMIGAETPLESGI